MMNLRHRISALFLLASLTMVGCFLPEGTKRITGGTGKSVSAGSVIAPAEGATETVISATVNITLGEQTDVLTHLASGKVDLVDQGKQVHIKSDIQISAFIPYTGASPVTGLIFSGYCSYQVGGGKPAPGYVEGFVGEADDQGAPHGTLKGLYLQVFDLNDDFVYGATALFENGSFVFHGQNGKPLK
jgi:hypothetical protein